MFNSKLKKKKQSFYECRGHKNRRLMKLKKHYIYFILVQGA